MVMTSVPVLYFFAFYGAGVCGRGRLLINSSYGTTKEKRRDLSQPRVVLPLIGGCHLLH